jgi:hypothetical protein
MWKMRTMWQMWKMGMVFSFSTLWKLCRRIRRQIWFLHAILAR